MESAADRFGLAGTILADRYRVERQVAEGGFAVVYRAHQIALDRPVALKVLKTPPTLSGTARERFEQRFATEARTIAKLQHPYIVDVYDYGVARVPTGDSAPWMALEWLEGETLEHELDRRRGNVGNVANVANVARTGRPAAEAAALLRPVIAAVAYAHKRGVVHRDIKPANIMIVASDAGPMLRMLDFGIAKIMEGDPIGDTRTGRSSGATGFSPDYAAPEQISYSRTGPWTDVHALGLLFSELLTGEPPFAADADAQLFEQVMSADRPTPRRRGVDAGPLEAVVEKALALSPSARWQDAGELLAALDMPAARPAPALRPTIARVSERLQTIVAALRSAWSSLSSRPRGGDPEGTWRVRRPRDLAMPVTGGAAILAVFAALVWALGAGGGRPRRQRPPGLPTTAANVSPWIVPMPECASPGFSAPLAVEAPAAARRPSRLPRPVVTAAAPSFTGADSTQPCAISVNSVPWSAVWIDGKNTGKHTPFVDVPIDCGAHRIDFKRPDLRIAQTESIVVRPGETFKRRYTLPGTGE